MFSRQELEDIWNNKPHGHFTNLIKNIKGAKKYRVTTKAYRRTETEVGKAETVCFAKNIQSAINGHSYGLEAKIRLENKFNHYDQSLVYRTTAEAL